MTSTRLPAVDGEQSAGPNEYRFPWWPWVVGTFLSFVGFGVSAYLTYEHYTGSKSLACPAGGNGHGLVNCLAVTTSPWSVEYGVPVSVLGLVFFAVMLVLQAPPLWRSPHVAVRTGRIVWCVIGLASAVKLIYDELYHIHQICLWCTSVHALTFLIFVATVFGTVTTAPVYDE